VGLKSIIRLIQRLQRNRKRFFVVARIEKDRIRASRLVSEEGVWQNSNSLSNLMFRLRYVKNKGDRNDE